ncbi:MAG: hypothetical protein QN144_10180 [Armatimonadota bacterium]|nr:hypothetical protein [Armatimonadota bacterium]
MREVILEVLDLLRRGGFYAMAREENIPGGVRYVIYAERAETLVPDESAVGTPTIES